MCLINCGGRLVTVEEPRHNMCMINCGGASHCHGRAGSAPATLALRF